MVDLADIFHQYGAAYRTKHGDAMLPSHRQAMADIEHCRTEAFGAQVYYCDHCHQTHCCYHSCKNRHCPKCQGDAAQGWLQKQQHLLLPVPYFMVPFTLPAELRTVTRRHQKELYNLLFRSSAAALQELALDSRCQSALLWLFGHNQAPATQATSHPIAHMQP